jgi:hypothetical protein
MLALSIAGPRGVIKSGIRLFRSRHNPTSSHTEFCYSILSLLTHTKTHPLRGALRPLAVHPAVRATESHRGSISSKAFHRSRGGGGGRGGGVANAPIADRTGCLGGVGPVVERLASTHAPHQSQLWDACGGRRGGRNPAPRRATVWYHPMLEAMRETVKNNTRMRL